jgi:hypothetical protein
MLQYIAMVLHERSEQHARGSDFILIVTTWYMLSDIYFLIPVSCCNACTFLFFSSAILDFN